MKFSKLIFFAGCILGLVINSILVSSSKQIEKSIIFDHNVHLTDAELSCSDCHLGIQDNAQGKRSMPDHDICSDCHEVDDDAECATCHIDPDNPEASKGGEFYQGFAHKPHLSKNLSCIKCHGDIQKTGIEPTLPAMTDCQSCHLDQSASLNCEICHLGEKPEPENHALLSWNSDHGIEASSNTNICAACHDFTSCEECHQGENLFGKPHPVNWIFNHSVEAVMTSNCMTCHETRESCVECHRAQIPVPHGFGPQFANKDNGGGDHKEEAEAYIDACLNCHDVESDDPTCIRCHE